jgi:hypothetical protein
MPKNKKRKKPAPHPEMGAYKHFLNDLRETLQVMELSGNFSTLSNEFKRNAFLYNIGILNPTAANEFINSGELKYFAEKSKKFYRERSHKIDHRFISLYQLQLFHTFLAARAMEIEKQTGDKKHPRAVLMREAEQKCIEGFNIGFLSAYLRMTTCLSNPAHKYYSVNIHVAPFYKKKLKMELLFDVYGFPAQKCMMNINGSKRPAFHLAKPLHTAKKPIEWITVDVNLLKNFYKGNKKVLDVFIQSHALTRMKERLDLLDQQAINYALWENTHTIIQFEVSHGYLLLPFKVFGIKIGYLVANVTDDKLLFRTFLFITHNTSPEGVKLRKLTGLGKEDITYWKIDRLSTFVKLKEENYPGLIQLFCQAGLGMMMELKDKEFTIDSMQAANLDGLTEYINRGKNEFNLMNLDWDTPAGEVENEPSLQLTD